MAEAENTAVPAEVREAILARLPFDPTSAHMEVAHVL